MSDPQYLDLKVAGFALKVPLIHDEETTRRIADVVSERIAEIAANRRVNTQEFALLAALSFAADAETADRQHDLELRDLRKALSLIQTQIRDIISKHDAQQP